MGLGSNDSPSRKVKWRFWSEGPTDDTASGRTGASLCLVLALEFSVSLTPRSLLQGSLGLPSHSQDRAAASLGGGKWRPETALSPHRLAPMERPEGDSHIPRPFLRRAA